MHMKSDSQVYKHGFKLTFLGSRIVKFGHGSVSNFESEMRSMSFGSKLNCGEKTNHLDAAAFQISEIASCSWRKKKLLQLLHTLSNYHTIKAPALQRADDMLLKRKTFATESTSTSVSCFYLAQTEMREHAFFMFQSQVRSLSTQKMCNTIKDSNTDRPAPSFMTSESRT